MQLYIDWIRTIFKILSGFNLYTAYARSILYLEINRLDRQLSDGFLCEERETISRRFLQMDRCWTSGLWRNMWSKSSSKWREEEKSNEITFDITNIDRVILVRQCYNQWEFNSLGKFDSKSKWQTFSIDIQSLSSKHWSSHHQYLHFLVILDP